MENINFNMGKEFFIIDSDNINNVNSQLYGYYINDGVVFDTLDNSGEDNEPSSDGCYVYVKRSNSTITIKQDFVGCFGIYLYKHNDYFAVSNSFMYLVDYLKSRKPITFNKTYADYLISVGMCSFSKSETLINEIEMIDRSAVITIDIVEKRLSQSFIDYGENTLSLDSKEGMEVLDLWFSKWTQMVRHLIDHEQQVVFDLSGGFDSRIPFVLALASGCDMSKVFVRSVTDGLHTHSEDFKIASAISKEFNFKLNDRTILDDAAFNYSLNDCINISYYIKGGFSNWFQDINASYKKRRFKFGGKGGECLRSYLSENEDVFMNGQIHKADKFGEDANSIRESIRRVTRKSLDDVYDKFKKFGRSISSEDITLNLFREAENRTHFGNETVESYFANIIYCSPLQDSNLHRLKVTVPGCDDKILLYTVIFDRYCPKLLEFPFEGGRSIATETVQLAKRLNEKYPKSINSSKRGTTFFKDSDTRKYVDIDNVSSSEIKDFYEKSFISTYIYHRYVSMYSEHTYYLANNRLKNEKFHRFDDVHAVLAICKVLDDVTDNQNVKKNTYEYLLNASNSPQHVVGIEEEFKRNNYTILNRYLTARIDLKNSGSESNEIEIIQISDKNAYIVDKPVFMKKDGNGCVIQSFAGKLEFAVKCIYSGTFSILLRGQYLPDKNGKAIPICIDYKSLNVNNKNVLDEMITTCHDRPFRYSKKVADGEIITISVEWRPYDLRKGINPFAE